MGWGTEQAPESTGSGAFRSVPDATEPPNAASSDARPQPATDREGSSDPEERQRRWDSCGWLRLCNGSHHTRIVGATKISRRRLLAGDDVRHHEEVTSKPRLRSRATPWAQDGRDRPLLGLSPWNASSATASARALFKDSHTSLNRMSAYSRFGWRLWNGAQLHGALRGHQHGGGNGAGVRALSPATRSATRPGGVAARSP